MFLLVLISLLSLRKYLRERGVPMETSFAIRWMAIGMASVFLVLFVLSLLPIPSHSLLSMELPFRITSRDNLKANKWGWGPEGAEGEGPKQGKPNDAQPQDQQQADQKDAEKGQGEAAGGKKDGPKDGKGQAEGGSQKGDGKQSDKPQSDKQQSKKSPSGESEKGDEKKGEDNKVDKKPAKPAAAKNDPQQPEKQEPQQGEKRAPKDNNQAKQAEPKEAPEQQQQQQAPSMSVQWNLPAAFQWLAMLILLIVAIVFGIKYRRELLQAFQGFRDWLGALFGRKKRSLIPANSVVEGAVTLADLYPPFSSFANPFASGSDWSREQIVRHIYRAVMSWGYEHRVVRREDETPEEFVRRLARRFPEQQEHFSMLGIYYNRIAYARGSIGSSEIKPMADLWNWLSR